MCNTYARKTFGLSSLNTWIRIMGVLAHSLAAAVAWLCFVVALSGKKSVMDPSWWGENGENGPRTPSPPENPPRENWKNNPPMRVLPFF